MGYRAMPRGLGWPTGRALLRDQGGNVVMLVALLLPALLGFGALAVDASYLYVVRAKLQGAADAAALAAVQELPHPASVKKAAVRYAQANANATEYGVILKQADVVLGRWNPSTGSFEPNTSPLDAVKITVRRAAANDNPVKTLFASVLGIAEVNVAAEAIAVAGSDPVCILALDPSGTGAIGVGNGSLIANGCATQVNSSSSTALTGHSGGRVSAAAIYVTGGYGGAASYSPTPETGQPALLDPLAYLEPPAFSGCDFNSMSVSGSATLTPGVYCGGLSIGSSGSVTLQPGTYVIKDGRMKVTGGSIYGDGVMFYVTGSGASVDLGGNGSLTLKAPRTGPLAGVLFFGDRNLAGGTAHAFRGDGASHYEGMIYFPTTDISIVGSGSGTVSPSPWMKVVAYRFRLNGNSAFEVNANYADSDVPLPSGGGGREARLVQ